MCIEQIYVDGYQRKLSTAERGVEAQLSGGRRRQAGNDNVDHAVEYRRRVKSLAWTYGRVFLRDYRLRHRFVSKA